MSLLDYSPYLGTLWFLQGVEGSLKNVTSCVLEVRRAKGYKYRILCSRIGGGGVRKREKALTDLILFHFLVTCPILY